MKYSLEYARLNPPPLMPSKKYADKKTYLYRITNLINGKDYVGITTRGNRRWVEHKSNSRQAPSNKDLVITKAMRKYGCENFKFEILSIARNWDIGVELEKLARALGMGKYNQTAGGDGAPGVDPEIAAARGRKVAETMKDHAARKKRSNAIKAFYAEHPEEAASQANNLRALQEDPEVQTRRIASFKATMATPEMSTKRKATVKESLAAPEVRAKMSAAGVKRMSDPIAKKKVHDGLAAYHKEHGGLPEHVKQAIGKANTGRPKTPEQIEQQKRTYAEGRASGRNIDCEETRRKKSESQKARQAKITAEGRKPPSPETRQKQSEAQKARFAREKAERENHLSNPNQVKPSNKS